MFKLLFFLKNIVKINYNSCIFTYCILKQTLLHTHNNLKYVCKITSKLLLKCCYLVNIILYNSMLFIKFISNKLYKYILLICTTVCSKVHYITTFTLILLHNFYYLTKTILLFIFYVIKCCLPILETFAFKLLYIFIYLSTICIQTVLKYFYILIKTLYSKLNNLQNYLICQKNKITYENKNQIFYCKTITISRLFIAKLFTMDYFIKNYSQITKVLITLEKVINTFNYYCKLITNKTFNIVNFYTVIIFINKLLLNTCKYCFKL